MSRIEHDWYDGVIPHNVSLGANVYLDTSYGFAQFDSTLQPGLIMGDASGAYNLTTFIVGPSGAVTVGAYTCLNGAYLICNSTITIGAHCLIAWGVTITDSWVSPATTLAERRQILQDTASDPNRHLSPSRSPAPVVLEDAVWVGFDSVILPGVVLGRGCVVGSKTVVDQDVPPYAVVVGNPMRIVRYLDPEDREHAMPEMSK